MRPQHNSVVKEKRDVLFLIKAEIAVNSKHLTTIANYSEGFGGGVWAYIGEFTTARATTENDLPLIMNFETPAPVPLPATLPLFISGLIGLGFKLRKKTH